MVIKSSNLNKFIVRLFKTVVLPVRMTVPARMLHSSINTRSVLMVVDSGCSSASRNDSNGRCVGEATPTCNITPTRRLYYSDLHLYVTDTKMSLLSLPERNDCVVSFCFKNFLVNRSCRLRYVDNSP